MMKQRVMTVISILLVYAILAQPALAWAPPVAGGGAAATVAVELAPPADAEADGEFVIIGSTLDPLAMERATIAAQLVEVGYTLQEAADAAAELTAEDLAVLLDNPKMMQPAGGLSNITVALIVGGLIVVGIIILAANGSGSLSIG